MSYKKWADKLESALKSKRYVHWRKECKEIRSRFNSQIYDEKTKGNEIKTDDSGYNLLFSNYKTIMPYLVPYMPSVIVDRPNKDKDDVARTSCQILERALNRLLDLEKFKETMRRVKQDYLLYGRGVVWNLYLPTFEKIQASNVVSEQLVDEMGQLQVVEREEALFDEKGKPVMEDVLVDVRLKPEYVNLDDFITNNARTYDEIEWVARKLYMSKDKFEKEFPKANVNSYVESYDKGDEEDKSIDKKICVWELWDKKEKKIHYISLAKDAKSAPKDTLRTEDDKLGLEGFFPCVILTGTTDNDSIIPIPDYTAVKSQYKMLDKLTKKLYRLMLMVKVVGWYAGDKKDIPDGLSDNDENVLYPVSNWAQFMDKGGIQGAISWLPLDNIMNSMQGLIQAIDKVNADIQRLLGVPNIMEGQTDAKESWRTNKAKGRYGTMRLQERQDVIQEFIKEEVGMAGELMVELFPSDKLIAMSNIDKTEDAQFIEPALEMLANQEQRDYNVDIETEGTKGYYDEYQTAQSNEFFAGITQALQQANEMVSMNPDMFPLVRLFIEDFVRNNRKGVSFEASLSATLDKMEQKLEQPKESAPDPEMIKAQAKAQEVQAKAQADMQKAQAMAQVKMQETQIKGQIELQKTGIQKDTDEKRLELERQVQEAKNAIEQAKLTLKNKELDAEIHANMVNAMTGQKLDTNIG